MHGIRFDPPCIVFPNTYINSTSRITIKALNESDKAHHISFRNLETIQEEIDLLNQQDLLDPKQRSDINSLFEYTDEFFSIEPLELEIWPHSFQQISFSFSPLAAKRSTSFAYVQIDEFKERYKMQIVATGLPPAAQFLTPQIIIGNVFLDSIFEYQVILKNIGDVPVQFCYEPHDTGNLLFEFNPSEGEIAVNNQIPIIVRFTASAVKLFCETFVFKIKGSNVNNPSLVVSGKVIGPTFSINPKQIDFGGVGYGFLYSKTIEIENNSEIPFDFNLRMSHDGSFERREFQLKPEFGTINKFSKQEVLIEFIPISVQSYSLSLLFDITRFGTNLAEIPITANCVCPQLELIPSSFDLKEAFIGYQYGHEVIIRNSSPYPAKFEIVPQDLTSKKLGIIESNKNTGLIAPGADTSVNLSLVMQSIGKISVDCFFRVFGSDNPPLKFTFKANSTGPQISLSSNDISFGTIPVLVPKTQELVVTNNSLIDAKFNCYIDSPTDSFTISPVEETIPANSSLPLTVTVLINDLLSFSGCLKLCFDYLDEISIPLKAQGSGSPITSSIDMKKIDFGYILTEQPAIKKFIMENKANRPFEIRFTPNKVQTPNNQRSDFVFTIEPEHVFIPGQSNQSFIINLHCTTVTPFKMPLQCHATIGRQRILLFDSLLKGSFVQPLVSFSSTELEFKIHCLSNEEPRSQMSPNKDLLTTITQPLSVTNKSKLTLPIEVDCPEPFSVDITNFNIEPEETKELNVSFDSSFKNNFVTEEVQRMITFSLIEHPQKIEILAKGLIIFPNLKLNGECLEKDDESDDDQQIDFGVLMMNTEQTKSIEMINNVDVRVEYEWQLLSTDLDSNKVFDIFPLYGIIEPNESIQAHFSFFALADFDGNVRDFNAKAVCHVTGGPDYVISLKGSSASILYKISPVSFLYSSICFTSTIKDKLTISNNSKTAISFTVKIPRNTKFQSFSVLPKKGIISPNDSASLSFSIVPGYPKLFKESFFIQIGDFEDVKVDIELEACFSQVLISLPRSENDASTRSLKEKVDLKMQNKASQALPIINVDLGKTKSNIDILKSQKQIQQFHQQQKELYSFTDDQLLEEEKKVILDQMINYNNNEENFQACASSSSSATTASSSKRESSKQNSRFVANYEIKFGEMIVSESSKKTFTIKSIAPFPITFEMDLSKLKKTGLKIEPSMVKDLMPENEVEIDVTFVPINRKLNETGPVCYNVPFLFNDNHCILLSIVSTMRKPSLNFSATKFDFDHVIIGQTKIMTIQLQNMSPSSCEFRIGNFEPIDKVNAPLIKSQSRRINNKKSQEITNNNNVDQSPFITIPDSGILPPSSFMNVAIHFSPISEKTINMKFPINISYNKDPFYATVSGTGDNLKLIFEPKELLLPTIQPYSIASTADVVVKNPNPYSIEFFSLQFDQQLITEETADPRQAESPFVTYTPKAKNSSSASKFALCIIINGPPLSGKSTIAKELSSFLRIPVINLKEIWSETVDYFSKLYTVLMQSEYNQGFIVDGLDCFDDNGENEVFLQSVFKLNKNASEDFLKNPFTPFNHQGQSMLERVLDIILGSLNGHFVFHIAIKLPIDETVARKASRIQQEEKLKLKSLEEEKEKLFSMSEDEYLKLNEDERLDIDNKRRFYRNKIIASIDKRNSGEGHEKKKKSDDIKASARIDKQQTKKKTKSNQIPNDPTQAMSVTFQYSLGIIAQKAQNATDRFKVIDPYEIRPKIEEINTKEEEEEEEEQKEKENNSSSYSSCEHSMNSLIVDGSKPVDNIIVDIIDFLPPISTLKEVAFKMQIPDPLIKDDSTNDSLKMVTQIPQFFTIAREEVVSQTTKVTTTNKTKGSNKEQSSSSSKSDPNLDDAEENIPKNLTNRWRLQPNEETKLTIHFESTTIGNLNDILLFSIAKCQMQPAILKVKGLCQYPEIDRDLKLVFDKLIKNYEPKNCPAFVVSQSEFNFGFCITCKDKPAKGQMQYKTILKLTNVSEFNADCQASFVSQTGNVKGSWIIEQPNFSIQPTKTYELTVGFHPISSELSKAKLGIFIKDNPEPLFIDFSGDSSIPIIEANQQNVDFEKVLIGNEKSKKIELKNTGKLSAYWKLKGHQQFSPNMTFSITEGELIPTKSSRIFVKFTSQKSIQIKKPLTIEVYDIEKTRLFSSFNVNITAESFDVNFDVMFPKGQQDQFDFGQLKVGQSKSISISLRNRGKYPVDYKFAFINKDVTKYLKLSSKEGSVKNGDKVVPITLTFSSNKVVKFDSTKFITLSIVDTQTNSTTAQLSYTVTASSFYSMFSIDCDKSIEFGSVQSNTNYHKEIVIKNKGPFSFDYDFQSNSNNNNNSNDDTNDNNNNINDGVSESGSVSSLTHSNKKKNSSQQGNAKSKQKKAQQNSIQVSAFLVYPATGAINPGASATISVDLNSPESGNFDASMTMNISEMNPYEKQTVFNLLANVFVPGLSISDKERLFPRLPFCIRLDLAKSDLNCYLEDENVVHFAPLIVTKKESVNVRLLNQQPIPIDVDITAKSKGKTMPFEISEKAVHINENDFANIVITFAPNSPENYQATFEAVVRNGTNPLTKALKFGIEGAGTIPMICLKTQLDNNNNNNKAKANNNNNNYLINIGKTNIGYTKQKVYAVGNDSPIPCTVLFQIVTKNIVDFEIKDVQIDKKFIVDPGHQFNFTVVHKPQKIRKSQIEVTASCIENPKSSISFSFTAEGFSEDVIFEGLEGDESELHFRGAIVGHLQSISFTMRNLSDATIRFQWSASNEFVFAPRVGHLKPLQSKEINVTFASEKPSKFIGSKGVCQVAKIELVENDSEDWDDTQKMLTFVPRSEVLPEVPSNNQQKQQNNKNKKSTSSLSSQISDISEVGRPNSDLISVAAVKPEPTYNLISSGRPKELNVKIFAISDVIKLSVDATDIPFSPTMMFQTRTSEFKMSNSSQIRIEYEWVMEKFESLRTDYAATRPCPFTIEPSSGFIEAGQQKIFKVTFAPMEVDDFVALFKCTVPYYDQDLPKISFNALSRRPICHFNVPLSDYLSRRTHEFTDQLPEGVKVIEVFAKSVKSRSVTKVEVINPTSMLYESKWELVKDNSDGSIICDNISAIISSGKKYLFPFSYCPKSAKTVECLYLFEIPEHEIKVYFLFVGRITH